MINIKILAPSKIEIAETSQKNILIYYIGYVTVKDLRHVKIDSINCMIIYL